MADYTQGVDAITRLVNMITPLQDIAVAIGRLGQIETATDQALDAHIKAVSDMVDVQAELDGANAKLDKARAAFTEMLAEENDKRLKLVAASQVVAGKIIAEARDSAAQMVADASTRIGNDLDTAKGTLTDINTSIDQARVQYQSMLASTKIASEQADKAQAKLDSVKAQLTKMIGQ